MSDVGPGALTAVLVERLGAGAVAAIDPSPPFVPSWDAALEVDPAAPDEARTMRCHPPM
jgi:hypothetical protein